MNIDSTIISGVFGFINLAIGFFLKYLFDALKGKVDRDEHDGTVRRLENDIKARVCIGHCDLKEKITTEKFAHIGEQMELIATLNTSDHNDLKAGVKEVKEDVRSTSESLAQINKCLALLTERISNAIERDKGGR